MTIELVDARTDNTSAARIMSSVLRWLTVEPKTMDQMRTAVPGYSDWLGLLDGQPVGYASCGASSRMGVDETETASSVLLVLPSARHQGVGGALYRRVSSHARELGRSELEMIAFDDDPDSAGFAARHGFSIVSRAPSLRLMLENCPRPDVELPKNIMLSSLAERPDLAAGVWETAVEAFTDIPFDGESPMQPGPFEEFRARYLAGPRFIPEATFVAVADDQVVGYGQLCWMSRKDGIGDHEMLAVRGGWRGRGLGRALKAAQIAWALENGLVELRTSNEERNVSVRAVNGHFPYTRLPDKLLYHGPCAPVGDV